MCPQAVLAQSLEQQWANCTNQGGVYASDVQVGACTSIIESGRGNARNRAIAFTNRGTAYSAQRDYERAIADHTQAISLDPQFAGPFYNRGAVYADLGDYARAITDYDRAIQLDPQFAYAFLNRGVAYANLNNYAQAIADYDQAIRINPRYALAFEKRGRVYHVQGDYARAIADYDQAIRINSRLADAFNDRGLAYADQHDYVRAIADFDEAIRIEPQFASAFINRGSAYADQRDYARAIADFDHAGELDPHDANTQSARCWVRAFAGTEPDVARAACDRALQLAPDSADALCGLGLLAIKQQRWQDAWDHYDAAVRASPANPHAWFGRGIAAMRLMRTGNGQADLARAGQLDESIARTYAHHGITP
jgi:tetratricopeptide (TPR) repeat protein